MAWIARQPRWAASRVVASLVYVSISKPNARVTSAYWSAASASHTSRLMHANGVTVFMGVPTMYLGLLDAVAKGGQPISLRIACSGGAPIPVAVIEKFKETFGDDYLFFRHGADVVVTGGDGQLVTLLKGGESNGW